MKTKGSLRRILPETRRQITNYILKSENSDKPRSVLAEELEDIFGDKSPSYETLLKEISRIRNKGITEEDKLWNLGKIKDYPIPPEALPYIMALQKWVIVNNEQELTIRQVLWASRLYPVVLKKLKIPLKADELQTLWVVTGGYAWYEKICQISGTYSDFDTTILDKALIGLMSWKDAMYSLIVPVQFKNGQVSPESFAWLLNKTKDNPEQRTNLFKMLRINTEKDGENDEGTHNTTE